MKIRQFFDVIKSVRSLKKDFGFKYVVQLVDDKASDDYAFLCSYRAQLSLHAYYSSFYPDTSFQDTVNMIRCSKALRERIKEVLFDTISTATHSDFNFNIDVDEIRLFPEFDNLDEKVSIASVFTPKYGKGLMTILFLRTELAYHQYLKTEKGYTKNWGEFNKQLLDDRSFSDECFVGFKYWLSNINIPPSVWSNKQVIGLMNEAKERIPVYGLADE